jgi:hypothetical protein
MNKAIELFRKMPGVREPGAEEFFEAMLGDHSEEALAVFSKETQLKAKAAWTIWKHKSALGLLTRYKELDGAGKAVKLGYVLKWLADHDPPLSRGKSQETKGYVAALLWDERGPAVEWLRQKIAELAGFNVEEITPDPILDKPLV